MARTFARMKYILALTAISFLTACGDGKKEAAEQLAEATPATTEAWIVDLSSEDLPLNVDLGDRGTLGADSAEVAFNEEFGHVRVKAGDRFSITVTEAPGDFDRLKADLERDMLQKHTVIEETPEMIIYRSQFPDDELVFIHFRKVITAGGRTFIVEDAAEGRFNEADIKRMSNAVVAKEGV